MIYKLMFDRSKYLTFDISPEEIEEKLGDFFILDEPTWSGFWKPLNAKFYDDSDKKNVTTPPDITCWFVENLVLNEKAYQSLKDELEPYGEILPVKSEGVPYWVLHITKHTGLEVVDEEKSDRNIEESGYIDIKHLEFKDSEVNNLLLFKTEYDNYKNIYCSDRFKSLVEKVGLQGLVFSKDLISVF